MVPCKRLRVWSCGGRLGPTWIFVYGCSVYSGSTFDSIQKINGSVDIFLIQRVVSIALVIGAILMPLLCMEKGQSTGIWTLYLAMCVTNPYIHSNSREIGNSGPMQTFDQYGNSYQDVVQRAIDFAGLEYGFFVKAKARIIKHLAAKFD